ncbi:MAG: decarboxylating NADP(+)-dependent phosphogluconate dehydrogenase [Thermoleophilia bacterium]|nr:decarboxylating NADP(+)-dependent phosphogluconate dehydrogenase [Thermoleophilia bacterium]
MGARADIGLVGLAVMGQNLALNIDEHGFRVTVWNRHGDVTAAFLAGPARGTRIAGAETLAGLAASLERPRRVLLMVKAGQPVDDTILKLAAHLEPGDVVIDGGNSHFEDTARRCRELEARGLLYVGAGISGGEEGARHGPSIMPGGSPAAWPLVRGVLQTIAARADGTPCCDWIGRGGSGHYVKMVHNGIEYGDMQVIAEAYHLLHGLAGLDHDELHEVFAAWNRGPLESYLVEITREIMAVRDGDGQPLVTKILDAAGQKGTGRWAVSSALELGVPVTLVTEAVLARLLSALTDEREAAAARLGPGPAGPLDCGQGAFVADVRDALHAAKIVSYAQGFMLFRAAAEAYGWQLDHALVAHLWRGGCIIRSAFLGRIRAAYERDPALANLLLDPAIADELGPLVPGWRRTVARAASHGIPAPAYSSALAFYDGYRTARLPASLIQAQRDYFGAHTYERVDRPRGTSFHTDWSGRGGTTTSGTYSA